MCSAALCARRLFKLQIIRDAFYKEWKHLASIWRPQQCEPADGGERKEEEEDNKDGDGEQVLVGAPLVTCLGGKGEAEEGLLAVMKLQASELAQASELGQAPEQRLSFVHDNDGDLVPALLCEALLVDSFIVARQRGGGLMAMSGLRMLHHHACSVEALSMALCLSGGCDFGHAGDFPLMVNVDCTLDIIGRSVDNIEALVKVTMPQAAGRRCPRCCSYLPPPQIRYCPTPHAGERYGDPPPPPRRMSNATKVRLHSARQTSKSCGPFGGICSSELWSRPPLCGRPVSWRRHGERTGSTSLPSNSRCLSPPRL